MIVCHCKGITDRDIEREVEKGAQSPRQVARACGASVDCGGCHRTLVKIVRSKVKEQRELAAALVVPGIA